MYPVLVYGTARLIDIESLLGAVSRTFLWSYAGVVLFGTQLAFAFLIAIDAQIGESIQFLALVSIWTGAALALYTLVRVLDIERIPNRPGAGILALATGSGTVLLLMTGLYLFAYTDNYALPLVRLLVTSLP